MADTPEKLRVVVRDSCHRHGMPAVTRRNRRCAPLRRRGRGRATAQRAHEPRATDAARTPQTRL